jgi:hypothetical protein
MTSERCYYLQREGRTIEVNLNLMDKGYNKGLVISGCDTGEYICLSKAEILFAYSQEVF